MPLTLGPFIQNGEVLVPPLNFASILPGVHRSGFPNKKNFPFMDTLNLRSIVSYVSSRRWRSGVRTGRADAKLASRYLSTDEYKRDTHEWAQAKGLHIFHLRIDSCLDLDGEDAIASALESILDTRNLPILIHDNKGRILPSVLSALLRLLQRWSFTAVLAEYRAFLPDEKIWPEGLVGKPEKGRDRVADLEFIDRFPLERITFDPRYRPKWLE